MTSTINVDPALPSAGARVEITYTGPLPVTLRWRVDNGTWVEFTLSTDNPMKAITLPGTPGTLYIEDLTGDAPYRAIPFS